MTKIHKIEDIYPLTIISMRFGGFAIIQAESECDCVGSLEGDEEHQYDPHKFMQDKWEYINYGIGSTILAAFENFKRNYK